MDGAVESPWRILYQGEVIPCAMAGENLHSRNRGLKSSLYRAEALVPELPLRLASGEFGSFRGKMR